MGLSVFEGATKAAIEEILVSKLHESKHGYVLTKNQYQELVQEIYEFLKASRNLKAAGDKLLGGGGSSNVPGRPKMPGVRS